MIPVYSSDDHPVGFIETSSCGRNRRFIIRFEPYRTQLAGVLTDYALGPVFGEDSFRLDANESGGDDVLARSLLEEGLFVPIGRIYPDGDRERFELVRVRPRYESERPRRKRRQTASGADAAEFIANAPQDAPILVSACLLGEPCRYDGAAKPNARIQALAATRRLIPVCPEVAGGLSTPRPPAERQGRRVRTQAGKDVTDAYESGAAQGLATAQENHCVGAILKAKSPACGSGKIYDGSFSRRLKAGNGVLTDTLLDAGIPVCNENDLAEWEGSK